MSGIDAAALYQAYTFQAIQLRFHLEVVATAQKQVNGLVYCSSVSWPQWASQLLAAQRMLPRRRRSSSSSSAPATLLLYNTLYLVALSCAFTVAAADKTFAIQHAIAQHGPLERPLLPASGPYVIAHRGASGRLPEHTVPAYEQAIADGADFIECDVVLTADLVPVCSHDPDLYATTDAHSVYPERNKTHVIDGVTKTGVFAEDLTLDELRRLRARQRYSFRNLSHDGHYKVATLAEYLAVAAAAPRAVGIYPELKHPSWHNALPAVRAARTSMEEILAHALASAGYSASYPPGSPGWRAKPVYVQSFEETSLQRFASLMPLPLVLLLEASPDYVAPDTGLTWRQQVSPQHLAELATYVAGIGPWKGSLFADNNTTSSRSSSSLAQTADSGRAALQSASSTTCTCTQAVKSSGLTAQLHAHAFSVHPYTLRDEAQFVLPGCGGNITCEIAAMFDGEQVDGAFTDWPATLRNALSSRTGGPSVPLTARVLSANSAVLWRQLVSRSPFSWLSLYK